MFLTFTPKRWILLEEGTYMSNSTRDMIDTDIGGCLLADSVLGKNTKKYTPYAPDVMVEQIYNSIEEITHEK